MIAFLLAGVGAITEREQIELSLESGYSHELQRTLPSAVRLALEPSTVINATPGIVAKSGDLVSVFVSRPTGDRAGDILAAYTPAGTNISEKAPARIVDMSTAAASYETTGEALVHLYLTNMRGSYDFVLFDESAWGSSWYSMDDPKADAVGRSEAIEFENPSEKRAMRILPADNDKWMLVWTSTSEQQSCLINGVNVTATQTTFGPGDMCGAPATTSGYNCLQPTTHSITTECKDKIEYECGDLHGVYSCTASTPTTLAIFGDLGRGEKIGDDSTTYSEYGSPSAYTARLLEKDEFDLIYHIGDISYAVGYASVWDDYLDMMAPVLAKTKYALNLGNHEIDYPSSGSYYTGYDSGGECGVPTRTFFPMPLWWSRDVGLAHVVAMCTEWDFTEGSEQWKWIKADLEQVDRTKTPWILFGGHRPMYIDSGYSSDRYNGNGDIEVMDLLIQHVEPLLLANKVDLAFWGHNHAVQRLCACANHSCVDRSSNGVYYEPAATVQMVVGTGGAHFTQNAINASFSEKVFYNWGYAKVVLHNETHLDWHFVDNGANGPDTAAGDILDSITIIRKHQVHHDDESGGNESIISGGGLAAIFVVLALSGFACYLIFQSKDRSPSPVQTAAEDDDELGHVNPMKTACEMTLANDPSPAADYATLI